MLIKFDSPIPLTEARNTYKDCVKFITTTQSYPNIEAIEFTCDPQHIFKRKALDPKVNKKANRIISNYKKEIESIWNTYFTKIKQVLDKTKKKEEIRATKEDKKKISALLATMMTKFDDLAEDPFTDAYKLGKTRGQIITRQEIDDEISDDDQDNIDKELKENTEYLDNFEDDLNSDIDSVLDRAFVSHSEMQQAIEDKVEKPRKSRALLYALATLGLVVLGTVIAIKTAKEELGHFVPKGGIWTIHPDEGKGGEVCDGCQANSGQFFTIMEFLREHGTNDCLSNCRCDLDFTRE